jgi:replicative DNA helicase
MASSEHLLISKIIQTASVTEVIEAGVRADHFTSDLGNVFQWVVGYWRDYGSTPTPRVVKQEFADLQLLNATMEPYARLIDELYEAYRHKHLVLAVSAATPSLNNHNTEEATKILSEGLQKAALEVARLRDVDLIKTGPERLERYKLLRDTPNSLRGLPTGFSGLDRITSGFRPQQLITLVGEAKKGKSLMTLIMAETAHAHGISPMYLSFEMSAEEQAARYDAVISGVSHTKIMRGDLNKREFDKIEQALNVRKNMHPFHMVEDSSSLTTVSAIASRLQQERPKLLIVDGVYLMDDEQGELKGSPQALTNITRSLKRLSQRFDIPIIGTTQVLAWKLGNKKSRAITSDSIGYSSSFVQDSDLVLGVESDPDIDNQSIIRVVIARSAPKGEVRIKWDWHNMDFTEVGSEDDNDSKGGSNGGWDY